MVVESAPQTAGRRSVGVIWTRIMAAFVPSGTCDCGHGLDGHMSGPQTRCVRCTCNAFFPATWLPR